MSADGTQRMGHPIHRRTLPEPGGEVNVDIVTVERAPFR